MAIEADTKLAPTWMLGQRLPEPAALFMQDLKERLANRVQLATDGHRMYLRAVADVFGDDIDFPQFVKMYGTVRTREGWERNKWEHATVAARSSPRSRRSSQATQTAPRSTRHFVERQKLTMRMGMRQFTRASNGHFKKRINHAAAQAINFLHHNFARPHKSLANPYPRTPAMAAGLADHVWTMEEIAALLDSATTFQERRTDANPICPRESKAWL